jgi:hypothetical protein
MISKFPFNYMFKIIWLHIVQQVNIFKWFKMKHVIFKVHFGGGLVGVLTVPLFSNDFGIVYNWDLRSAYVSTSNKII